MRCRLHLERETIKRLEAIGAVERLNINDVICKAAEEIADRGFTDKVVVKGRIG